MGAHCPPDLRRTRAHRAGLSVSATTVERQRATHMLTAN